MYHSLENNIGKSTDGTKKCVINHVLAIGHADKKHVVQRVDSIQLAEQLIDLEPLLVAVDTHCQLNRQSTYDAVAHACSATGSGASLLAYRVQLIKNDDVQLRLVTLFLVFLLGVRLRQ